MDTNRVPHDMSKFVLSLAAIFVGLGLVGLSYSWPKMQTTWTDADQKVLSAAGAKWHASTDPHASDPKESPAARAARIEDLKQKYLVERASLASAQATVARTANLFYYAGIALGTAGLIGVCLWNPRAGD